MAISCVDRQVGLYRLVFTMIIKLSIYILFLELSGVLEGGSYIGRKCSTIISEDPVGRI